MNYIKPQFPCLYVKLIIFYFYQIAFIAQLVVVVTLYLIAAGNFNRSKGQAESWIKTQNGLLFVNMIK